MNGIIKRILLLGVFSLMTLSCLKDEKFVQDVFVYKPVGVQNTISQIKSLPADAVITDEVYIQGYVTSSDADGNYSQKLFFQDETAGIGIVADLGSSNQLFPIGGKISVQCKGLVLADVNGVTVLASSITGEGLDKTADPIDNRTARKTIYAVEGDAEIQPEELSLSEISASDKTHDGCLVTVKDVFFQTSNLPYANEGGSSEQYRTLYDKSGSSILLCTSDGSTMAGTTLPSGAGSVTGILTYPNGTPVIMMRSEDDIMFSPSSDNFFNDPDDKESDIMISEYYSSNGAYYIEVTNVGTKTVNLGSYCIASDIQSDGSFTKKVALDNEELGPFGMAVYANGAAKSKLFTTVGTTWDPLRTNYSSITIDALDLDGNSQVALMLDGGVVDVVSTTSKSGWALNKTLIRRPGIKGHSKASDFTRADAGWITKVSGYAYNMGNHRFYDTDPNFDSPAAELPKTLLELRSMSPCTFDEAIVIKGRITSDRTAGNVASNRLFMQDESNRGICIDFREGQNHAYNAGDEITINLYGASLIDENGVIIVKDCVVGRSELTSSPNAMPEPIEASVSQIGNLQSMYIYIKEVQVSSSALSSVYGDGQIHSEDLFANEFYITSMETASFAANTVAQNSGSVAGIALCNGDRLLLMPRNASDLEGLTEERFVPIVATPVPVSTLKTYSDGTITADARVTVFVTSDNTEGNMASNLIFVQDENDGFQLQLPAENKYEFGQTLIVVLTGATISSDEGIVVTPAAKTSVVAIGAPDPSFQPQSIKPSEIAGNLCELVTISDVEVEEESRLKTFEGRIGFDAKGTGSKIAVVTSSTASWKGSYIPTAKGSITGLVTKDANGYVLYPRKKADLSGLPVNGTRLSGEKVVYFVPSTDPAADLFISETVFGDLDANGKALASAARNKCNSKFVELFNPTGDDLVLSNYRVSCIKYNNSVNRSNIVYYRFPEGLTLKSGHTVVFKYVSKALGSSTTSFMTNTLWPSGYTGDSNLTSGVTVDEDAVPGVLLFLDARDYEKTIANSTQAFPAFDGNDILVVQKTTDGGTTWTEIDRVFSLPTADNTITGKVTYPFLKGYCRKSGVLGTPGNVTDVQASAYTLLNASKRNENDFGSVQCNPVSGGAANWIAGGLCEVEDLGVHAFSIKPDTL